MATDDEFAPTEFTGTVMILLEAAAARWAAGELGPATELAAGAWRLVDGYILEDIEVER